MPTSAAARSIGDHLRLWRQRQRLSQLDLACEAEVSTRHLSFLETGRAAPSREMVLRLAERLEVPMRERNVLLLAAGYAPLFPERPLADPQMAPARAAVDLVLAGQRPYPAFALDRFWRVAATNGALPQLYDGVAPELLEPPVNVVRLSLHPQGLAPRILNLAEWSHHLTARLRAQVELTADPTLAALLDEALSWPRRGGGVPAPAGPPGIVAALRIAVGDTVLSLFSTTMVFGSALDVTLSELTVETFFPADAETDAAVRALERVP
jgi:transcriptional regulator with XRE-family HTH domain